ncbi:MAG: TlpA disulfide reductase family protein [Myxococcales bacterium]
MNTNSTSTASSARSELPRKLAAATQRNCTLPAMQALSTKYAARGLVVLGVAADDNPGLVQQRLRELGITYPNVIDAEGSLRGALRVKELPTTLVIDRAGSVG